MASLYKTSSHSSFTTRGVRVRSRLSGQHFFLTTLAILFCALCGLPARSAWGQVSQKKTYCNPVDINYKYQRIHRPGHFSYCSGADPVIVPFKGDYYLFVTNSGGWWHSTNLGNWEFVTPTLWPRRHVNAPAVRVVHDTLFMYPSGRRPLLYSTDPASGQMKYYNRMMPRAPGKAPLVDPDIFYDKSSGNWFMYYGSSNFYPIYGIRLDHAKNLAYMGKPKPLLRLHPEKHGWERFGYDHRDTTIDPFIEGAWMTKYKGTYYLQYGAPGTEYNVYANGTYTSDHPMGPFTYAPYNPVSYKPGGFVTGAGHGNTFRDDYGNYWNTGTCWIGVNWKFERRIVMFPAGFDKDGEMYSNTRFGDFPHYLPTGKWKDRHALFTGWMLLSYKKPATASSVQDTFNVAKATDENPRTFWVAQTNHPGEGLRIDLQKEDTVRAVQVNFADYKTGIYDKNAFVYTQFRLYASRDGKKWTKIADLTHEKRFRPDAYVPLDQPVVARYIKYENVHVPTRNLAVSDIRIFGNAPGSDPQTPQNFKVVREPDRRDAVVSWDKVPGAVGYNILWGIGKNKLYETYQIFADQNNRKEIRALNVGQDYYFAIEAFNEHGVSKRSEAVHIK